MKHACIEARSNRSNDNASKESILTWNQTIGIEANFLGIQNAVQI